MAGLGATVRPRRAPSVSSPALDTAPIGYSVVSSQPDAQRVLSDIFSARRGFLRRGTYANVENALRRVVADGARLVVIDLPWLGAAALAFLRQLNSRLSAPKTLLLYGPAFETCEWLRAGLEAGADGLLARPLSAAECRDVARSVLTNRRAIAPSLLGRLPAWFCRGRVAAARQLFSTRETHIVALAAVGLGDRQIAQWLHVSRADVDWHWRRLFARFRVHNRASMVTIFLRGQWLPTVGV